MTNIYFFKKATHITLRKFQAREKFCFSGKKLYGNNIILLQEEGAEYKQKGEGRGRGELPHYHKKISTLFVFLSPAKTTFLPFLPLPSLSLQNPTFCANTGGGGGGGGGGGMEKRSGQRKFFCVQYGKGKCVQLGIEKEK